MHVSSSASWLSAAGPVKCTLHLDSDSAEAMAEA